MTGFINNGVRGLGDLLYESANIAFDTSTGLFTNPQTGTTYGATPPAGGWPISWYQDSSGQVQVPTGSGAVAQDAASAQQIANTVVTQLAAQGQSVTAPQASVVPAPVLPATPGPALNAAIETASSPSTDLIYSIPSTNANIDLTQLWNNYWWVLLGAGAVWFLFFRNKKHSED